LLDLVERLLVAGRRNTLATRRRAITHRSAQSDDWYVNHQLTNGGTEISECEREHENYWPVTARRKLRVFRAKTSLVP
jgi:hypothetical protein